MGFQTTAMSRKRVVSGSLSHIANALLMTWSTNDAVLKFEPFVLHVQCRRLEDAQLMAIRSTHGLEVPLTHNGKLLVEHDYIHFLIQKVNAKMEQNIQRIQRFYKSLQAALSSDKIHNLDTLTLQNEEDLSQTKETEKEKE
ncbi:tRNA wybutosine-synthesizing protein 3 homolog isoform 6-T6 [Menidia menidia]